MANKKPFKFQSLLKLNNRIVEQDLREVAGSLLTVLLKLENKEHALELNDAISRLALTGSRLSETLHQQKSLTHTSSQEDLEKFFKLITQNKEQTKKHVTENASKIIADALKDKISKSDSKEDTCECPACQLRRGLASLTDGIISKAKFKSTPKSEPKKETETSVKLYEVKLPKGTNPEQAIQEIISKLEGK